MKTLTRVFSTIGVYAILGFGALLSLFPLFWMISTSLKEKGHIFVFPPEWFPNPVTLHGYQNLLNQIPLVRNVMNSLIVCIVVVAGQLLFNSMAAYAFARLKWPGREKLFLLFLATLMIPGQVTLIPNYIIIRFFGWVNSLSALIVPPIMFSAFGIFLMRQFFMSIPNELEDAAKIDGANHLHIFLRIMLPLVKPALISFGIFALVYFWNDFTWPLIVLNSKDMKTLTVAVATMATSAYFTDWVSLMAGATLSVIPLLVLFFIAQREFVEGIVMTGLKG